MNDQQQKIKESKQSVANAFKNVLIEVDDVQHIKEISFNGSYFDIGFASKKNAMNAMKTKRLSKYQYDNKSRHRMFKYPHRLIGLA